MSIKDRATRAIKLLMRRYTPRVAYRYAALRTQGVPAFKALRHALVLLSSIRPCSASQFDRASALPGVSITFTKSNGITLTRAGKVLGVMTSLCAGSHFLDSSAFAA
jgi:hypothetical protein